MKRKWKHWAICAAGARLLSGIRFFQLLNLKALDAQFVARGRLAVSDTPEMCMYRRPLPAQATRAAAQPIPSAQLRLFAMQGQHDA